MNYKYSTSQEQAAASISNVTNNYYGPVIHRLGQAQNANFGVNNGQIQEHATHAAPPVFSPGAAGAELPFASSPGAAGAQLTSRIGLAGLLNPILDASHTRNRKTSPPNSHCLKGTRTEVIHNIISWATSTLSAQPQHITWLCGYTGCGKSAIAQAVSVQLAERFRLGASFFFFRGSADRSRMSRFAATIASQVVTNVPGAAKYIEMALAADPGILAPTTSLVTQLSRLVYDPIESVSWKWYRPWGYWKPFVIVVDGLDECEEKEEAAAFIKHLVEHFERHPDTPLRVLITSLVEDHLHTRLRHAGQVRLLDLVDHTSDQDIAAALDAAIEDAKGSLVLVHDEAELSQDNKRALIQHIGGSFIFMTTITKFLFAPSIADGLTPSARLPHALSMKPNFDELYTALLIQSQHLPQFSKVLSTVALAKTSLSIAQIADLLEINLSAVAIVLISLPAIIQVPADARMPYTLWHTSLLDFLTSKNRSGPFFANPTFHKYLALRCAALICENREPEAPAFSYASRYAWDHYKAFSGTTGYDRRREFHIEVFAHVRHFKGRFLDAAPDDLKDELYSSILANSHHGSQLPDIISTILLAQEPLSIARIAEILSMEDADVACVLRSLHDLIHIPEAPHDPVRLGHTSLYDFFNSESRSGSFVVSPRYHEQLACRYITLAASSTHSSERSQRFAVEHWRKFLIPMKDNMHLLKDALDNIIAHLQRVFPETFSEAGASYFRFDHRFVEDIPHHYRARTIDAIAGNPFLQSVLDEVPPWSLTKGVFNAVMTPSAEEELLGHLQSFYPHLLNGSGHLDTVVRGLHYLAKSRRSSGGTVTLHSGNRRPDYSTEYMFSCWPRHLALAMQTDPRCDAFDLLKPTQFPVGEVSEHIPNVFPEVARMQQVVINLELADRTAGKIMGYKAPMNTNTWDWDAHGDFIFQKATTQSVSVYDVLECTG